ncbi:MAG: hypothetical protein IRZ16_20550 [Myxococcaceae bacterium]|nr:hypothetical protein [Myxococcaceae bacterium]
MLPISERTLALTQGAWWLVTGTWPILDLRSFERITGPKREGWLVKTVGALVAVIGAGLLIAGLRRRPIAPEVKVIAAGAACALGAVDLIYPLKKQIPPVYLADVLPELGWAIGWVLTSRPPPVQPAD